MLDILNNIVFFIEFFGFSLRNVERCEDSEKKICNAFFWYQNNKISTLISNSSIDFVYLQTE